MSDIERQAQFIVASVPRILAQIDHDPLSPTWGCAHLAYWRDKTSDVCDMRRQEAMLSLAMIYVGNYPDGSIWAGSPRLFTAVTALLGYWCRSQYPDGSFDEWYKGERAYAACAFSTHAVARTLDIIGHALEPTLRETAQLALRQAACWLAGRNDLFKTNHQAVGAAAMAWAGKVLAESAFSRRAREKIDSIVALQSPNGWFPEVGGTDMGYTFLTVEYAAVTMSVLGDWSWAEPFTRAMDAACEWLHPDLTLGGEYGICHNPYVSRVGALLMAERSPKAAWLARRYGEAELGFKGLEATLGDDLRLLRWGFQPLAAFDLMRLPRKELPEQPIPLAAEIATDLFDHQAGLARIAVGNRSAVMAACAGGILRLFNSDGGCRTDFGYALALDDGYATNLTYNPALIFDQRGNAVTVKAPVARVSKFFPPYWARIVLRLACSTAWGARTIRRLIDVIRRYKGTPINQSSTNLATRSSMYLTRRVERLADRLVVCDQLTFDRSVSVARLSSLQGMGDTPMVLVPLTESVGGCPTETAAMTIVREWQAASSWRLISARVE